MLQYVALRHALLGMDEENIIRSKLDVTAVFVKRPVVFYKLPIGGDPKVHVSHIRVFLAF